MNIYKKESHGVGDHGWLYSRFHFSFADYFNEKRMGYGSLRVLNDDRVTTGRGFELHPHRDMEIISYVVEGELTHKDSMGSEETLYPGEVQYMSAGTGVFHSEYNRGSGDLRFLQIWILPDKKGHSPNYGSKRIPMEERRDRWLHLVSPVDREGLVHIHQDTHLHCAIISEGKSLDYTVDPGRGIYGIVIDGSVSGKDFNLNGGDGFDSDESLSFKAEEEAHILIVNTKEI